MDEHLEPMEQERRWYYSGLPSSPRLVARSGTAPWTLRENTYGIIPKGLYTVINHPIVEKWNDDSPTSLCAQVVSLVERRGLQWHAIDVLKIGYTPDDDVSPVVLISVESESLSWRDGHDIVTQCRRLLASYELHDVHCEIKESRLVRLAAEKRVFQLPSDESVGHYAKSLSVISDCVGNVISPSDTPFYEGTSCLYLRERFTDATYALTCRHVCFGAADPGDSVELIPGKFTEQGSAALEKPMMQPGTKMLNAVISGVQESHTDFGQLLQKMERRSTLDPSCTIQGIEDCRSTFQSSTAALAELTARVQPSSRVIGHVAYFRKYGIRNHEMLSDWSLIRLNPARFERPMHELQNRVFIGNELANLDPSIDAFNRVAHEDRAGGDGTIRLHSVLGVSSLPIGEARLTTVAKRGGASGLTLGKINGSRSVTRTITGSESFTAREWCVLGRTDLRRASPFSCTGDSGACVWEVRHNRIVGMITSGLTTDQVLQRGEFNDMPMALDVTYMTPMEWIMEDLAACGLELDIL